MNCKQCGEDVTRRYRLTKSTLCAGCKSEQDDFKWKMKTVGFNDKPTIAKSEEDWKILKRQRAVKDI